MDLNLVGFLIPHPKDTDSSNNQKYTSSQRTFKFTFNIIETWFWHFQSQKSFQEYDNRGNWGSELQNGKSKSSGFKPMTTSKTKLKVSFFSTEHHRQTYTKHPQQWNIKSIHHKKWSRSVVSNSLPPHGL